jgi:hypothetical protein
MTDLFPPTIHVFLFGFWELGKGGSKMGKEYGKGVPLWSDAGCGINTHTKTRVSLIEVRGGASCIYTRSFLYIFRWAL